MSVELAVEKYLKAGGLLTNLCEPASRLVARVKELSLTFTKQRPNHLPDYFDNEKTVQAYIAAFVLTNVAKIKRCLVMVDSLMPKRQSIRILDLGCGPGTALLAASEYIKTRLPSKEVFLVGIERSSKALEAAKELFSFALPKNHHVQLIRSDISNAFSLLKNSSFDITIAANLLNELGEIKTQVRTVKNFLSISGLLILLDPALKNTSRELMELRDLFLEQGLGSVLSPCTHQFACPMLIKNPRDWCHFYLEWQRPKLIEHLDRLTGLDHRYLKMSYCILNKKIGTLFNQNIWRAVSSPLISKGKREIFLCGNGKIIKVRRLDRNKTDSNRALSDVMRGDLVHLTTQGDLVEMAKENSLEILKRFNAQQKFS